MPYPDSRATGWLARWIAPRQRAYWHFLWLTAIVAVGCLLRLVQVEREALWGDEALTLLIKHWPVSDLLLRPVDPTPGLYYILTKWFVPDGAGVLGARALPVLFGTASIAAIYAVARMSFSPRWGLVAAAMLAVSPVLIDYSQEARAYSLLILLILCSAAGLLWWARGLRSGRLSMAALTLFALATLLSFYTHFTAVFWILPVVFGGREITERLGDRRSRRAFLAASAAMALAAIPELVRTYDRAHYGGLGFLTNPGVADFLATVGDVVLPSTLWNGGDGALSTASLAALVAVVAYSVWRLRAGWPQVRSWASENPAAPIVLASLLFVPLAVWLFSLAVTPIFMVRTILPAVPGFILLLVLVGRLERPPIAPALFMAASAMALDLHGTVRQKEPWQAVAQHLKTTALPGDAIVVCPDWKAPALMHALGGAPSNTLFVVSHSKIVIMRPELNGRGWEGNYYRPVMGPAAELGMGIAATAPTAGPSIVPGRVWVVESGCPSRGRQLVRTLVGRSAGRQLLRLEGGPLHTGVRLSLFEGRATTAMVHLPPGEPSR